MCMKWNKPTPPSRFPRSLACWTYNNNDLGYPLGGVGLFHTIHIAINHNKKVSQQ